MRFEPGGKRIALVVAHPDDETLAAGAHLKYWADLTIVHVTDGAPRDGADARRAGFSSPALYAKARRQELESALRDGEAGHARLIEIGVPDQEAIDNIGLVIEHLREALAGAEVVITHPYEGGHPDHDACALACRAARPETAALWEFAGYHLRNGAIENGEFLGASGAEVRVVLSGEDLRRKETMLQCFRTQLGTLSQFRPDIESFRRAPEVDFAKPPHPGTLLYETWGFAMDGQRWREYACEALHCR
jgi:LmbE family N-acetylglucosaminyl deacetylase